MSQTALITGATGAIGEAIALGLAKHPDFEVHLVARDRLKAERVTERVRRESGNPHVRYHLCDLSRRAEIYALAAAWQGPLNVLINNAATAPRRRQETPEGIELMFAVNALSYFWMT